MSFLTIRVRVFCHPLQPVDKDALQKPVLSLAIKPEKAGRS
jgi:hypothetical protein